MEVGAGEGCGGSERRGDSGEKEEEEEEEEEIFEVVRSNSGSGLDNWPERSLSCLNKQSEDEEADDLRAWESYCWLCWPPQTKQVLQEAGAEESLLVEVGSTGRGVQPGVQLSRDPWPHLSSSRRWGGWS